MAAPCDSGLGRLVAKPRHYIRRLASRLDSDPKAPRVWFSGGDWRDSLPCHWSNSARGSSSTQRTATPTKTAFSSGVYSPLCGSSLSTCPRRNGRARPPAHRRCHGALPEPLASERAAGLLLLVPSSCLWGVRSRPSPFSSSASSCLCLTRFAGLLALAPLATGGAFLLLGRARALDSPAPFSLIGSPALDSSTLSISPAIITELFLLLASRGQR